MQKITIELCLGSSCFARGNSQALSNLEGYIKEHKLEQSVELVGHLCLADCSRGPNLKIDSQQYAGVRPECVVDLLVEALSKSR
jgi:NADH:ubiquinone oxidoreductase subunit E